MTVYTSPNMTEEPSKLKFSKSASRSRFHEESFTAPRGKLHGFLVGDEEATNKVAFEPENLDFERAMLIMRGTQRDKIYQEHGSMTEEHVIYMAVTGELLNASAVGQTKVMMDGLYAVKGDEIQAKKRELVAKYASDEQMRSSVE